MKRVLVTGSNGLLGQTITLLAKGHNSLELICSSKSVERFSYGNYYVFESLDITRISELSSIIERYKPEIIINTAAITQVDYCEENRAECYQTNIDGLKNLIYLSAKYDIHLIQLSSDFIFDGLAGPYSEDDFPNPINYYGLTKLQGEQLLADSEIRWSVIRTILVFGITEGMSRSNLVLWVKGSLQNGEQIKVVTDHYRMPTYVDNLAGACISVAQKGEQGIFHVSGTELYSIFELANIIANHYGLDNSLINPVHSSTLNEKARRPAKTGFVITKAVNILDYKPCSFDQCLKLFDERQKLLT